MPEEILNNEATVLAEETKSVETTVNTPTAPEVVKDVKKKKNPIVVILLILVGLAVLCCSCTVGGIYLLNRYLQNTPQSVAVRELYTALSENNKTKVETLTTEELFSDLYKPYSNGKTLADFLKDSVESVTISAVEVNNDGATVTYTLKMKNNAELFKKITYAELQKGSSNQNESASWYVSYLGPQPTEK